MPTETSAIEFILSKKLVFLKKWICHKALQSKFRPFLGSAKKSGVQHFHWLPLKIFFTIKGVINYPKSLCAKFFYSNILLSSWKHYINTSFKLVLKPFFFPPYIFAMKNFFLTNRLLSLAFGVQPFHTLPFKIIIDSHYGSVSKKDIKKFFWLLWAGLIQSCIQKISCLPQKNS